MQDTARYSSTETFTSQFPVDRERTLPVPGSASELTASDIRVFDFSPTYGGGHQKSCTALVSALTLSSEGNPVVEDPRSISWKRID